MARRRIKVTEMEDYYLIGLLTNGNYRTNIERVKKEFTKRLNCKSTLQLLLMWNKAKDGALKELLEETLADRYKAYEGIYEFLPNIAKRYLEEVSSFDAVAVLSSAKCEKISQIAIQKYRDKMEEYLEYYDLYLGNLYETEGSDLATFHTNRLPKQTTDTKIKEQKKAKIYKISDFKSRRK